MQPIILSIATLPALLILISFLITRLILLLIAFLISRLLAHLILLLIVFPHYRITRLVAVALLL